MEDYREMYLLMFNKLSDTIVALTALKKNLIQTQQIVEEHFLSQED